MNVHDAALAWWDAGACVLPAADDGSKRPGRDCLIKVTGQDGQERWVWDPYKTARPTRAQVDTWAGRNQGIGLVCGTVSGNIEMFEAEAAAYEAGMVDQLLAMLPSELVAKLNTYFEVSPKGGVHWIFRVDRVPVKGNTKLARRPGPRDTPVEVLFETRGEGGWTIAAPSGGRTHPTGKPWKIVAGSPGVIPVLTAEEYRLLHACAATFDAIPSHPANFAQPHAYESMIDAPGADFETKATWEEILIPAGWTKVRQRGDVTEWVRPGKKARDGISATTGWQGDWLYVFTTSTQFESERTYTKFGAYALLQHGGDFSAAARGLRQRGYGAQRETPPRRLKAVPQEGFVTGETPTPPPPPKPQAKRRQVKLTGVPTKVRPVQWWWQDRMPAGALSLLAGREGIGKSVIGYTLVAQLTRGVLKGRWYGRPRTVIICATEDSWEHTITPRLMAAGADLQYVLQAAVQVDETESYFLSLPEDLEGLEEAIKARGDVAMLLLDPLISRLDGNLDTHKDADVRQALEPLVRLADRTNIGILGLIHVNKSGSNDPLSSLMGSRAFSAVARSVAYAIVDRDDPTVRLLGIPKNNLGRDDLPSLRYSLEGVKVAETEEGDVWAPKLHWGEEDDRSVADVLADNNDHRGREPEALEDAVDWLTGYLAQRGGSDESGVIKRAAKAAGHSERTLARARKTLHIEVHKLGFQQPTNWALPGTQVPNRGTTADANRASRARGASPNGTVVVGTDVTPCSEGLFPTVPGRDGDVAPIGVQPLTVPVVPTPRARGTAGTDDLLPDPEEDPDG